MPDFNFSEITKNGWHPKGKDGKSKESWRGDFKGLDQISGLMGKVRGETPKTDGGATESSYTPMPISSLKDPASFAPPPKRTGTAGRASPGTNPAGGSVYARPAAQQPEPEPEEERPPPQPYRKDTTGLSTAHLPPPPGRRDGADGRAPAPAMAPRAPPQTKPKPSLPPRLPPRQSEHVDEHTPAAPPPYSLEAEPPAHQGILNQGAMNRLGAAGVSVPGFGIAPSPSPPLPARRQGAAPPPPVSPQKPSQPVSPQKPSQLGELQARFAKFSASSPESQHLEPAPVSQGTTWAQKQAALKTASSFRNDPSSVSFSDARTAASTANNFRERHGAQVASAAQSANNLNNKYGLTDKAAAYGAGTRAPAHAAPEQAMDYSNEMNLDGQGHSAAFKKAPPPPPKKRPDLVGTQKDSGPPPPIPISSKPKPPITPAKPVHQPASVPSDFDLALSTAWFVDPVKWPPPHLAHDKSFRYNGFATNWVSYDGVKEHAFTGIIIHKNLAKTKIHITWEGVDPASTARDEQRHLPPPKPLTARESERCRKAYNEMIARWCERQMGKQVGNGECWTLANEALNATAEGCRRRGKEGCMASIGFVHGSLLYEHKFGHPVHPPGGIGKAGVARGDIMQFFDTKFDGPHGWKFAGAPDHTAVIRSVDGESLTVMEQNNGCDKVVREGHYCMSELIKGEVRVFRPVSIGWMGDLSPCWP